MDAFEFEAPQLFEHLKEKAVNVDTDGADSFFSKNMELNDRHDDRNGMTPKHKNDNKDQFFTPMAYKESPENVSRPIQALANITNTHVSCEELAPPKDRVIRKAKRRSWGLPKQEQDMTETLRKEIAKLSTTKTTVKEKTPKKQHEMTTRKDSALEMPIFELRNRQIKRHVEKRKGSPLRTTGTKFMTLAEKMYHFEKDTPPRFRSKLEFHSKIQSKLTSTIPNSPKLITKTRSRHSTYPTTEDRIFQELKEQKSIQVKPGTLNRKIFQPPDCSNKPAPKSSTIPEPFNLTQVQKKEPPKEECFQFKARPVPKSSLNVSVSSTLSASSRTRCLVIKESDGELEFCESNIYQGMGIVKRNNLTTKVEPFKFEERNKQRQLAKEEKIRKIIEEEQKIPIFRAQPVPHYITRLDKTQADEVGI